MRAPGHGECATLGQALPACALAAVSIYPFGLNAAARALDLSCGGHEGLGRLLGVCADGDHLTARPHSGELMPAAEHAPDELVTDRDSKATAGQLRDDGVGIGAYAPTASVA